MNYQILRPSVVACAALMMPLTLQAGEIDDKSREVLDSFAAFYAGQDSISGTIVSDIESPMQNASLKSSFIAAAPNKVSIESRSDDINLDIVSNGDNLFIQAEAAGVPEGHVKSEAPATFGEFVESEDMQMLGMVIQPVSMIITAMDETAMKSFMDEDIVSAVYNGLEDVDGVSQHHLTVTTEQDMGNGMKMDVPMQLWIAAGDKPALTKVVPEMMGVSISHVYTEWDFGHTVADSSFAFTPKHEKAFDSFMEMVTYQPDALAKGDKAPDFELEKLDGGTFSLAAHKGKVVVLDFWATWCGPCRQGLPIIVEVTDSMKDRDVVFYSVNLREDRKKVTEFLGKQDYSMGVLMDGEGKVGDLFGVSGIPHTVIIDKNGSIAKVHVGFSPELKTELTEELNEILSSTN